MARLCSLTKTEFFCVPTQWFVVDATKDHSAVSWVKRILTSLNEDEKNGKEPIPSASSVGIDYVRVPWPSSSCSLDDSMTLEEEEDDAENESNDEDLRWKRLYADHIRPKVLAHFQTMFNLRRRTSPSSKGEPQSLSLHSSTRGRLVVWVVGELARPLSALILEELPVDLTNMVFWKTGGLKPAVVRVALVPNEHTKNSFLNQLSYQYFGEQPTNKASSISSSSASVPSSSSSSSPLRQHQQPPTCVQHNEYDCCLLVHDTSRFKAVLRRLVQLHVEELHLIQELTPVPHKPGELLVMDPTKRWRKVNWFSMTQPLTFPRLWRVTSSDADETRSLLQKLDGTLSTRESIEVRRELNWNTLALVAEAYRRPLDLAEDDPNHRISRCDEWTRREFIQYLQKRGMFKESLQQIEIAKQNGTGSSHLSSTASSFSESSQTSSLELTYDPSFMFTVGSSDDNKETKLPLIYLKLEGMALLQMGKEAEGKELLKIYVDTLLEEENKGTGVQLSATKLNEIASVALYNNDFTLARCYALKSIERDKYHQPAYKTLLWIAQQSADVNYVQEEALFFYFVHMLCDPQQAQQYYSQTMQRSPDNLFAMAYYSAFLAEVQGNGDEAEAVARQACEALEKRLGMESVFLVANENSGKTWEEEEEEDTLTTLHENELSRKEKEEKKKEIGVPVSKEEAWVFGSFATLLYQRSPVEHREPIQRLYARALEVDPENLLWQINSASFLMLTKERAEEGLYKLKMLRPRVEKEVQSPVLLVEYYFYLLCYCSDAAERPVLLRKVKACLDVGARLTGWDLTEHMKAAEKSLSSEESQPSDYDNKAEHRWLTTLAEVISKGRPMEDLHEWPLWKDSILSSSSFSSSSSSFSFPSSPSSSNINSNMISSPLNSPRKRRTPTTPTKTTPTRRNASSPKLPTISSTPSPLRRVKSTSALLSTSTSSRGRSLPSSPAFRKTKTKTPTKTNITIRTKNSPSTKRQPQNSPTMENRRTRRGRRSSIDVPYSPSSSPSSSLSSSPALKRKRSSSLKRAATTSKEEMEEEEKQKRTTSSAAIFEFGSEDEEEIEVEVKVVRMETQRATKKTQKRKTVTTAKKSASYSDLQIEGGAGGNNQKRRKVLHATTDERFKVFDFTSEEEDEEEEEEKGEKEKENKMEKEEKKSKITEGRRMATITKSPSSPALLQKSPPKAKPKPQRNRPAPSALRVFDFDEDD